MKLAALKEEFSYFWWRVCLHVYGVWKMGPLGYYRHRRLLDGFLNEIADAPEGEVDAVLRQRLGPPVE